MKLFTNPQIILYVSHAVLAAFFDRFTHLLPNKYALPAPRSDNENHPFALAEALDGSRPLPPELLQALEAVESLASPPQPTLPSLPPLPLGEGRGEGDSSAPA